MFLKKPLPKTPMAFVLHFLSPFAVPVLVMVLLEAIQAACQISIPYAIKKMIDAVLALDKNLSSTQVFEILKDPFYLFLALSIGVLLASRTSGFILIHVGPSLRRLSRFKIYSYLQHHSHRYFTTHFSGSIANRINEVSVGINHALWTAMFDFWPVMITFGVSTYLLMQVSFKLAIYLLIWIIIFVGVSFLLASRARVYAKKFAAARSFVNGKMVDSVTNVLNTKMFSQAEYERRDLKKHLDFEIKKARSTFWFMEKMRWFQFTAALFLQVGVLFLATRMWVEDQIKVGDFAMVTSLSLLVINDAKGLSRRFLEFFEYVGNISDGVSVLMQPHEVVDIDEATELKVNQGHVTYQNVSFQYKDGKSVFNKLNVNIKPGERVGLVGFSGSGKSTFVNLLTRLYNIQSGAILIDDQDILKVTQDTLRRQISMIPQDPILFHRTLLENIRYGDVEASDEAVIEAAKKAHAHEFIMDLPEQYNSLVGERGVKLSGGQRQRIAIARAILKNAPLLILDEATSSLDSVTEKLIQDGLEELMQGKTVIVIAHRLSTILHMDRILVFNEGQIIEEGSHKELVEQEGHYYHLWSMQAGGFLPHNQPNKALEDTFS